MTKEFESLDEVFNVSSEIVSKDIEKSKSKNISSSPDDELKSIVDDIKRDYDYARGNMYSIIEKGQEALDSILELAQETESPRAYEVVGQIIKNVSDSAEKLIDLHKKIKEIDQKETVKGPTNVTNALFVGSTAELSKLLKNKLNNEENK